MTSPTPDPRVDDLDLTAIGSDDTGRPLALVTGASSGIGLELARQFAEHGFDLVLAAEDEGVQTAAAELSHAGVDVHATQVDLSTYDGVEQLVAGVRALDRPLDAAAINAGVGVGGPFAETDLDAELTLVQLNVASTVHLAKRVVQDMVAGRNGRILFTSSIASTQPGPFEAVYAASKAFVQSFAEALREELKDSGVTVTSLMPGPTDTNFFHRADMDDTRAGTTSTKDEPAKVARQGYDALMAGKEQVAAGSAANKAMRVAGKVVPDAVKAKAHRGLSEPGSGE